MTMRHTFARFALCGLAALAVSASALAADKKTTNTLLGAGLGAAAGAILSEGDPMLTLGGAAAGGLLGHVLTEDDKRNNRHYRQHYKGSKHQYRSKPYYVSDQRHYKKHHKKYNKKHHKKYRKHKRRYR